MIQKFTENHIKIRLLQKKLKFNLDTFTIGQHSETG